MFRLHAVISCQDHGGTHGIELAEITVNHGVEILGALFMGGKFMLDIIGGRQIHHIGLPFFQ